MLLVTSIFLITFNQNAFTHSGRTASDGCHNEKSTGARHCHNTASKILKTDTYPKKQFDRKAYNFKSYKYPANTHSFYIGSMSCKLTVDHVVSLKDIHEVTGFKNVNVGSFKQLPILWSKNLIINYFYNTCSELTRLLVPNIFRLKSKWIRFSKEIMLISSANK